MATQPQYMTPEEYLEFERNSPAKHEYIRGTVVAMSGSLAPHNRIAGAAFFELTAPLRDGRCEVFNSDQKVQTRVRKSISIRI